ncbi:hypothetical protein CDD82_1215 [Ophiocordyceps australis]|uniref:Cytidine deaminase n=1 Tax=Ophiocordyceps australis TaxID=1399860 RepID=A0A2C5YT00_9HYPO|nr:hypothetical protein CDD82_1215 [Ophiocordyceps australis]
MATTLTPDQTRRLQSAATQAKATAYCPYSHFRVGAAVLGADGTIIPGANVENASYPVGSCAERVAVARAVTQGTREFCALAVASDVSPPASPCGMCRQFIREFCSLDMPIFMLGPHDECVVHTLAELLPMSFGPEQLKPAS